MKCTHSFENIIDISPFIQPSDDFSVKNNKKKDECRWHIVLIQFKYLGSRTKGHEKTLTLDLVLVMPCAAYALVRIVFVIGDYDN